MYGAFPLLVFNAFFSVEVGLFKILINPKAAALWFSVRAFTVVNLFDHENG